MPARKLLFAFCLFFAPLAGALPPNDAVVTFNEIHYNPATVGEEGEWLELFNQMAVNVDLSGWQLSGGVEFPFPDGTVIPGGGRLVIAKTPADIAGALGPFTGALNNAGETLRLRDNSGRVMDELTYGDKGEWPVAPDGSGVTLAKRHPYSGSARATHWVPSAQVGGTPGELNFPGPPPPVTTRVIGQSSTWKYNASGAAPAANWNQLSYNDSAWSSGQAGFEFGAGQVYMDPPTMVQTGLWSMTAWTGDADSGISNTKTYTHKVALNRTAAMPAINGVTFDASGAGVRSGANWSLVGADSSLANNPYNALPGGTGSRELVTNFYYGATQPGIKSQLNLTGLTPGQAYVVTLYIVGYDANQPTVNRRRTLIAPTDGSTPFQVDGNQPANGNGATVRYRYTAPASGNITFDFTAVDGTNTWHHYAFSNEVAAIAPVPQVQVSGVSIADVSSELVTGFTRNAVNCVNGSSLTGDTHGVVPDGAMWLSNGNFATPNDLLPAVITFDLGSVVHLTSFHVWNYNEQTNGLTTRGSNQVEVLVAQNAGGPFTSAGTTKFFKASGLSTEVGQRIELDRPGVRFVRFNITTNYTDPNQFAGLSEVKFYKEGTVTATPVPYREKITSLYNTGVAADGTPAATGTNDLHYTNVGINQPAVVQNGHPAWLANDGVSQWSGVTAQGTDNVPPGQRTWRTTFNLSGYVPGTEDLKLYLAADNRLDNILLNGVSKGISAVGFASYLGPYSITGANPGANTIDFLWTNDAPGDNPGGFRIRWDAIAQPILAHTTLPANPVTTYFRQTFTNPGGPQSTYRLVLNYVADDGAVFYLNGTEVHRVRVTGTPTSTTLADSDLQYPMFNGLVEVPASALVPGTNVFAVELHQGSVGNADAFFLATLDLTETPVPPATGLPLQFNELAGATAGTFFVELRNTGATLLTLTGYSVRGSAGQSFTFGAGASLGAGALLSLDQTALGFRPLDGDKLFLAAPGGTAIADAQVVKNNPQGRDSSGAWLRPNASTPGGANTFSLNTNAIVINEIMYHHHPTFLPTGATDNPEEWVELHNRTAAPVVLTGWGLRGGISFDFAAGQSIPPGGYLVVSNNPAALLTKFPGITVVGPFAGALSNSEDVVRIEDAAGNPVNEVHYFHSGRWDGRADGGGGSLELRNPDADNSVPESWAASDETSRSAWQTFSYSGTAAIYPGSNEPTNYNELVLGLLNDGEFLIDDISVKEVSVGNRECIQNGTFDSGTANFWRNIGTHGSHGRTVVVDDPSAAGNKVLKVVATGATEHMHNHCETTFKNGATYVPIVASNTYAISFRARWLSGSPRLHTRLYFNRLARQHLLPIPDNNGTPGAPNSRLVANLGPTLTEFAHTPAVPDPVAPVTVRVRAADPQGVSGVALKWRLDGAATFNTTPMTLNNGFWEAGIIGQPAGVVAQFYVEATDNNGGVSTFPAAGPASRALVRWKETAPTTAGHGFRLLMLTADADFLHLPTNVMSNDRMPCTVIYRESEVFYDAHVQLKSSEHGRNEVTRVGFTFDFDPMQPFRGTHESMSLDRSCYGRGTTSNGYGMSDIVNWQFFNRAGGIPSMYNDVAFFIAPRSQYNGCAQLTMAEFNDAYLDSQFPDGATQPVFKYELIYVLAGTTGGVEGLKLPAPDDVRGTEFENLITTDKEAFRWILLIGNARTNDDYSGMLELNQTFRAGNPNFNTALPDTIDVDQWMRTSAALALAAINDSYMSNSNPHNIKFYSRADGRLLMMPWDVDYQTFGATVGLILQPDITRITNASPIYQRLFYQHLQDIINTSFNTAYLAPWITHYQTFNTSGGNWAEINAFVDGRVAYANSQINALYPSVPFAISSNGGNDFSAPGPTVTLGGSGWINVRNIVVQGSGLSLPVTWTTANTWQVIVPIAPGPNAITLEAYNIQGGLVGTDTITITGTGTIVPAIAGNLVISELHYHPLPATPAESSAGYPDGEDFEFIELTNIGSQTVNLSGCRFVGGLDYNFPNTTLDPGARAVVARRSNALLLRHPGIVPIGEYYQPAANFLSNGGEQIALLAADGSDIVRFSYGDGAQWPASADGGGPSLVLMAPRTNPDAGNPLHWRASVLNHGNPGSFDSLPLPADLTADDDADGLTNLVEHALGSGALPVPGSELVLGARRFTYTIERNPRAEVNWDLEASTALPTWAPAGIGYEISARTTLPSGAERITLRATTPVAAREFLRTKLTAKP